MKKLFAFFIAGLFVFSAQNLSAQINIEDVIADTACICLQKIKTDTTSTKISAEYNACMSESLKKNNLAIMESYNSGEQGKKIDEQNRDNGRLMIKTQNVLAKKCPDYDRVYGKIRSMHQSRKN